MTRIGLISDTHNNLPVEAVELLRGSDHIIHAGDICEPRILWELECIAPVTAVLGNNDFYDYGPTVNPVAMRTIGGYRFVVAHRPEDLSRALRTLERDTSVPVIGVYGHKHVPYLALGKPSQNCDILVSPGSVTYSRDIERRRAVGIIDIEEDRLKAKILDLNGNEIFKLSF